MGKKIERAAAACYSAGGKFMSLPMESSPTVLYIIAAILTAILLFTLLKGALKMLVLAVAVSSAVAVWMFLQKNGFTYLEFVTDAPRPWMVQAVSWGAAGGILLLFFHGMLWASQLFSFNKKVGAGGIITTVLMCVLMLWVAMLGVSYYGDICRIRFYHELALAQQQGTELPEKAWATTAKEALRQQDYTAWLEKIDPMENAAQVNLACLVAFGCAMEEPQYRAFYENQLKPRGIPQCSRFIDLFSDPGLRNLVKEGRYVTLLENSRLTTFLQFKDTEEKLRNIL